MVAPLGINVRLVFTLVFTLGAALAGFAGVLGGTVLGVYTGGDSDILLFALAVVIIGGLGSFEGAIVGSLIIGLARTTARPTSRPSPTPSCSSRSSSSCWSSRRAC